LCDPRKHGGVAGRQSLRARSDGAPSPLGVRKQSLTGEARGRTGTRHDRTPLRNNAITQNGMLTIKTVFFTET
jgi:hypothetical protein